jgi:cobalt/nickel transport system ATP-binding protein
VLDDMALLLKVNLIHEHMHIHGKTVHEHLHTHGKEHEHTHNT